MTVVIAIDQIEKYLIQNLFGNFKNGCLLTDKRLDDLGFLNSRPQSDRYCPPHCNDVVFHSHPLVNAETVCGS